MVLEIALRALHTESRIEMIARGQVHKCRSGGLRDSTIQPRRKCWFLKSYWATRYSLTFLCFHSCRSSLNQKRNKYNAEIRRCPDVWLLRFFGRCWTRPTMCSIPYYVLNFTYASSYLYCIGQSCVLQAEVDWQFHPVKWVYKYAALYDAFEWRMTRLWLWLGSLCVTMRSNVEADAMLYWNNRPLILCVCKRALTVKYTELYTLAGRTRSLACLLWAQRTGHDMFV